MKKWFLGAPLALALASGVASAAVIDSDPANDVQAGADFLDLSSGSIIFDANLIAGQTGDVDWFTFNAPANSVISIIVIPLGVPLLQPDTILGLFDADGNMLAFNDDAGPNFFGSFIAYETNGADQWWFAVSGFGDAANFDGSHFQTGLYTVKVSIVPIPTPGAFAIVGLAGLAAVRRRR
jgi:hypothetical protein